MSDTTTLEYSKVWGGLADERATMIQIGNNNFAEHGSIDRLVEEKQEAASRMLRILDVQPTYRLLEIGTGLGIHTAYFSARASFVYTVDVSNGFSDHFAKFCGNRPNVKRIVRSFHPMLSDVEDGEIDAGFSTAVFCHLHVYDIALYFEELKTKLRSKGKLYINFQNSDNGDLAFFSRYLEAYRSRGVCAPIGPGQMQFHSREFFHSIGKEHGLLVTYERTTGSYTEMVFEREANRGISECAHRGFELGDELVFAAGGNAGQYLRSGFSQPESWGVWTVEPNATIALPVTSLGDFTLWIEFQAFARAPRPPAGFHIEVNGQEIGAFSAQSGKWGEIYERAFPISEGLVKNTLLTIQLNIENGATQGELGPSRRPIGIGLRRIRLQKESRPASVDPVQLGKRRPDIFWRTK